MALRSPYNHFCRKKRALKVPETSFKYSSCVSFLAPYVAEARFVDAHIQKLCWMGVSLMPHDPKIPLVLAREQVRDVDRRAIELFGMSGIVLMENAGRNAAEWLRSLGITGRVVICCGKGNNGGDGFVMARHLENAGIDVRVLLSVTPSSFSGDAAVNLNILERSGTCLRSPPADWDAELAEADWIVDALLGTGTQGTIREPYVSAIDSINRAHRKVFAVDLPSGMDCDTGLPLGCCVRANHTATFVARKTGFDVPGADQWTGQVRVMDIGVPRALLKEIVP